MRRLLNHFVKAEDKRRQYRKTYDYADDNSFCHNKPQIHSQFESHKTESGKAGDCRDRAARDRLKRIGNRMCHSPIFVSLKTNLIGFITFQKENRIIHRHSQLQYRCQRLRYIGNLTKNNVAPQIIYNRHSNSEQEYKRGNKRIHRQKQNDKRKRRRYRHIDRHFRHRQILDVGDAAGHTADKHLLFHEGAHILNSLHRRIRRRSIVKKYNHHRGIVIEQRFPILIRQYFGRYGNTANYIIIPENIFHMFYFFYLLFQSNNIFVFHVLDNYHGKCSHTKLIYHNILSGYGFQ